MKKRAFNLSLGKSLNKRKCCKIRYFLYTSIICRSEVNLHENPNFTQVIQILTKKIQVFKTNQILN